MEIGYGFEQDWDRTSGAGRRKLEAGIKQGWAVGRSLKQDISLGWRRGETESSNGWAASVPAGHEMGNGERLMKKYPKDREEGKRSVGVQKHQDWVCSSAVNIRDWAKFTRLSRAWKAKIHHDWQNGNCKISGHDYPDYTLLGNSFGLAWNVTWSEMPTNGQNPLFLLLDS